MKKILSIAIAAGSLYSMVGCEDMNSINQGYLDQGEDLYIGTPYIVAEYSGFNRIELVWKLNADPKIVETCIYWNEGKDSVVVPADRSDTVMRKIIDLPEDSYIFELLNRNASGVKSLTQIVASQSFGESYQEGLYGRNIISVDVDSDGVSINWASQEGCVKVELEYENRDGEVRSITIGGDEFTTVIADYVAGGEYSYVTYYRPTETAIDVIPSLPTVCVFPLAE